MCCVHEVTIIGASVVPEFPVVAIAAIIGVVAVLGRTQLLRSGI